MAIVMVHVSRWDEQRNEWRPTEQDGPFEVSAQFMAGRPTAEQWLTWAADRTSPGNDGFELATGNHALTVTDENSLTLASVRFEVSDHGIWRMTR